jgi:hypothetical protein
MADSTSDAIFGVVVGAVFFLSIVASCSWIRVMYQKWNRERKVPPAGRLPQPPPDPEAAYIRLGPNKYPG